MVAQVDDWFKRMGTDRGLLVRAIRKAKPDSDPNLLAEKLNWFVDANGDPVQPDDKGEFPVGSVPYAAFAWRNVDVRNAYQELDPGRITAADRAEPLPALDPAYQNPR